VEKYTDHRPALAQDSDTELMLRVGRDHLAAYEELYARHRNLVYCQLFTLLRDHHTAEDLCQEVFLRIYRHRRSFEPRARFCTWMSCITRRVGLNALRNRRRRRMTCASDLRNVAAQTLEWRAESASETPDVWLLRQERRARVRAALTFLPRRQQAVVVLQQFQQLRYSEIARRLNISATSVQALLSRARRHLRETLASDSDID
jgi:RNA polymerase sigma-70 factor (ECF subfamily)